MELTLELKTTLIHVVAGCILGFVSSLLTNNLIVLAMMLVAMLATGQVVQRVFNIKPAKDEKTGSMKYDKKWWLSNGVYPYVIFWLLVWILFYNL